MGAGLVRKERVIASYYQMSGGYFFFPTFFVLFFGLALVFLPVLQPQVLHIFVSPLLFFACKIGRQVKSSYRLYINRLGRANQLEFLQMYLRKYQPPSIEKNLQPNYNPKMQ
jgi:hypothetical protein